MNTCKTCKYYNDRECSSEKFVYNGMVEIKDDMLEYWDYEGYSAGFNVGPDFGCIHHESV